MLVIKIRFVSLLIDQLIREYHVTIGRVCFLRLGEGSSILQSYHFRYLLRCLLRDKL